MHQMIQIDEYSTLTRWFCITCQREIVMDSNPRPGEPRMQVIRAGDEWEDHCGGVGLSMGATIRRAAFPSAKAMFEGTEELRPVDTNWGNHTDFAEVELWNARSKYSEGFVTWAGTANDLLNCPQVVPEMTRGKFS